MAPRYFSALLLSILLAACSSNPAPVIDRAPVGKTAASAKSGGNANGKPGLKSAGSKTGSDWRPDSYTVKKGDTLFSIGLEYGYDYKEIAQANNISSPYKIRVGQTLKLNALKDKASESTDAKQAQDKQAQEQADGVVTYPINTESVSSTAGTATASAPIVINEPKATREPYSDEALKAPLPTAKPVAVAAAPTKAEPAGKPAADKTNTEIKPETKAQESKSQDNKAETNKAETKPSAESTDSLNWAWPTKGKVIANFNDGGNKGIDIAGTKGQAIQAVEAGKVIYSGSDLRGYGKLVIIKHNSNYLSVYANNNAILVKEGQQISRGQKIAEMGDSDSNTVKLHFEIRQQGKSVDPAKFLATN